MEKFPHALGFKSLDPFSRVSKQGPCVTAIKGEGGDKRLVDLELACKPMVLNCQVLFNLATAATAEAILLWISAEQVPSLQRIAPRYLKLVTSSNFWPFMQISAMLFMLTTIPYAIALSMSLLVRS